MGPFAPFELPRAANKPATMSRLRCLSTMLGLNDLQARRDLRHLGRSHLWRDRHPRVLLVLATDLPHLHLRSALPAVGILERDCRTCWERPAVLENGGRNVSAPWGALEAYHGPSVALASHRVACIALKHHGIELCSTLVCRQGLRGLELGTASGSASCGRRQRRRFT